MVITGLNLINLKIFKFYGMGKISKLINIVTSNLGEMSYKNQNEVDHTLLSFIFRYYHESEQLLCNNGNLTLKPSIATQIHKKHIQWQTLISTYDNIHMHTQTLNIHKNLINSDIKHTPALTSIDRNSIP